MAKMPQTPFRSEFTNQAPFAGVDVSPGNGLQHVAEGLDQLSVGLRTYAKDRDEASAMDAYAKASIERQNLLYDPNDGIFSKNGALVDKEPERFASETARIGQKHSAGLPPSAQEAFNKMWTRSNLSDREGVVRHVLAETEKYKASAADGVVSAAMANAVQGYNDPEVFKRSKSEIAGAVMFKLKGQAPEVIDEALRMEYSKMHMGVIQQLNDKDVREAYAYLKLNKGEMTATDFVQAGAVIRPKLYQQRVADTTDEVIKRGSVESSAWKSMYPEIFGKEITPENAKRAAVEALLPSRFLPDGHTRAAVMGLIQQESSFNPKEVVANPHLDRPGSWMRKAGGQPGDGTVVGLMQVMVFNAKNISRELGDGLMEGKSQQEIVELLKNPEINLRYGSYQFGRSLKKFGGDVEAALVDYNSGRGDQWLKAGRDYSVIPHGAKLYGGMTAREQTMDYVAKVMRNIRGNLDPSRPKTFTSFNAAPDRLVGPEVAKEIASIARADSPSAQADLEPGFKYGLATMLHNAPAEIKKGISWSGVTSNEGAGLSLEYADDASRAWVKENAPAFGLSVPEGTDKVEKVISGESATAVAADGSELPASADVPRLYDEPTMEDWLAQAESIQDPKLRKDVMASLSSRFELERKADKERVDNVKTQMWQLAFKGEPIPDEMWQDVPVGYANEIKAYQEKMMKGDKIPTDWGAWSDLSKLPAEEMAKLDPMVYRNKLADAQFTRLTELVRDARGDAAKDARHSLADTSSTAAIIERAVGPFRSDKEAVARFGAAVDKHIDQFFAENKRNPTATEKTKIVDELVLGGYFEQGKRVFDIKRGETVDLSYIELDAKSIPPATYTALAANFRSSQGSSLTEQQAKDFYGASIVAGQEGIAKAPAWAKAIIIKRAKDRGETPPADAALNSIFTLWSKNIMGAK